MRAFPIIPLFLMIPICIGLIIYILLKDRKITHILCVILLFIINLRFMIPGEKSKISENNVDVLFAIDSTISMNAEDYNGKEKRLIGVKKDCKKIIEQLNGARFSIITFNNDAKIMIPFTKDATMTYESIDIIEPIEKLYAKGTSLNTPREVILQSLKNSYEKSPDRLRVLIIMSDGEITDNSTLQSYASLKKYTTDGMVLGYGTSQGGYMKYTDKYSTKEDESYIIDYTNGSRKAVSKIDENNLKKIANDIGITYIHMDHSTNMDSTISRIKSKMKYEMNYSNKTNYNDIYYIFVFPLLILLAIELKNIRRHTI